MVIKEKRGQNGISFAIIQMNKEKKKEKEMAKYACLHLMKRTPKMVTFNERMTKAMTHVYSIG